MFNSSTISRWAAALLGLAPLGAAGRLTVAPEDLKPARSRRHFSRAQPSINHARLAARSHAGKPAGYVKAY